MTGIYYILTALAIVVYSCSDPNEAITPEIKPDNPSSRPQSPLKCIPVSMEEFRELYHPSAAVGIYINDHTVFPKAGAGANDSDRWNVIGITNYEFVGGTGETHFANGVGRSLDEGRFIDNPNTGGIIMNALEKQTDPTPNPYREGILCWAPHVVYDNGTYHMFYFSVLSSKWNMEYATSTDLIIWKEHRKHFCDDHKSAVINHSFENGTLDGWTKTGQFGTHMINDSFRSRYGTYRDMVGKKTFCSYADNHNGGDGQRKKH